MAQKTGRSYRPGKKKRMNLEKTVNHGDHGVHREKTRDYLRLCLHPLDEFDRPKTQDFRRAHRG
jgi:hypothetical protein